MRTRWKVAGAVALALPGGLFLTAACSSPEVGLVDGRLRPCPGSPNCVNSQDPEPKWQVEPLPFVGSLDETRTRLRAVLADLPRTTIVREEPTYLHVEFRSAVFRFVDDVEFLLDEAGRQVHVRSASRVGHSDLGVNRARVEAIRQAYGAAE